MLRSAVKVGLKLHIKRKYIDILVPLEGYCHLVSTRSETAKTNPIIYIYIYIYIYEWNRKTKEARCSEY